VRVGTYPADQLQLPSRNLFASFARGDAWLSACRRAQEAVRRMKGSDRKPGFLEKRAKSKSEPASRMVSEQARKALNTDGSPASALAVPGSMSWGRRMPRAAGEALRARVSRCKCKPKVVPQRDPPDEESGVA